MIQDGIIQCWKTYPNFLFPPRARPKYYLFPIKVAIGETFYVRDAWITANYSDTNLRTRLPFFGTKVVNSILNSTYNKYVPDNNEWGQFYIFGDGTTPTSAGDYYLEAPKTSGSTSMLVGSNTLLQGTQDGKIIYRVLTTFVNNGNSDFTFSELGVVGRDAASDAFAENIADSAYVSVPDIKRWVMYWREVFPQAITVPVSESITVSVDISFDLDIDNVPDIQFIQCGAITR